MALFAVSSANAMTTLTFSGDDFSSDLTFVLSSLGPAHQGYTGGPAQTWGFTTSSNGGWLDFAADGKTIGLEAGTVTGMFQAASSFFTTTEVSSYTTIWGPRGIFDIDFGFTNNVGSKVVALTNGSGHFDTVAITSAPEPATWVAMLIGFVSLGLVGRRASRRRVAVEA